MNIWQNRRKPMTQSKEAKVLYYASPAAMINVLWIFIIAAFLFTGEEYECCNKRGKEVFNQS